MRLFDSTRVRREQAVIMLRTEGDSICIGGSTFGSRDGWVTLLQAILCCRNAQNVHGCDLHCNEPERPEDICFAAWCSPLLMCPAFHVPQM